jgi:hypothetical protein
MKNCYTTRAYGEVYDKLTEEELRSGKLEHEARTIVNESGTCQVNLTDDEVQEYLMVIGLGTQFDADVWIDTALGGLIKWLKSEEMLEPIAEPDRARCPRCGIPTVPDHEDLKPEAAICNECHSLGHHTPEPWYPTPQLDGVIDIHSNTDGLIGSCSSEANARLIAAAPELLAALQGIKEILDGGVIHRHETGKPTWNAFDAMKSIASAAIAKATHPTE